MAIGEQVRGEYFQVAYYGRVVELYPLLTNSAKGQARSTLKANKAVDRAKHRELKRMTQQPGLLDLKEADEVAKRFGLWSTLRHFDWNARQPANRPEVSRIDADITSAIWELDVGLRRQIEPLLIIHSVDDLAHTSAPDPAASDLRERVEQSAGGLAALIDLASSEVQRYPDWDWIARDFDLICNSLDRWLDWAGSPSVADEDV